MRVTPAPDPAWYPNKQELRSKRLLIYYSFSVVISRRYIVGVAEVRKVKLLTMSDFGFFTFIHEPSFFRLLDRSKHPKHLTSMMVACTLRQVVRREEERYFNWIRIAEEPSPDALLRADLLFEDAFRAIKDRIYDTYGPIDVMVSFATNFAVHMIISISVCHSDSLLRDHER